jgi:hypothetical protein
MDLSILRDSLQLHLVSPRSFRLSSCYVICCRFPNLFFLVFLSCFRIPILPEFYLKKYILANFPQGCLEPRIADSVDFVVEQVCMTSLHRCCWIVIFNSVMFGSWNHWVSQNSQVVWFWIVSLRAWEVCRVSPSLSSQLSMCASHTKSSIYRLLFYIFLVLSADRG